MRATIVSLGLLSVCLGGCGQPAAPLAGGKAVDYWLGALQSTSAKVRTTAVTRLGHVGGADPAALPAVFGALRDPDPGVRCAAVLALAKNESAADAAVPALAELNRRDPSARVRTYATRALGKFRKEKS